MNVVTARKWFRQALHDLEMAEKNIGIGGYDVAAFLAHQSVEKLLKSLHVLERTKVPKTHFIDELAEALNLPEESLHHVYELTADYTLSRYPDVTDTVPFEHYTRAIAKEKVQAAKEIFRLLQDNYSELAGIHHD